MKVLVAGDREYAGAVLAADLRAAGHEVTGPDLGFDEGCRRAGLARFPVRRHR